MQLPESHPLRDYLYRHVESLRADCHKSLGKETFCIFKDLIPLTKGNRKTELMLEGRVTRA